MSEHSTTPATYCVGRNPVWKSYSQQRVLGIPQHYQPWLTDRGSLTKRLIDNCPGHFRVQVLMQKHCRPMCNEALRLQMPCDAFALVREVFLLCDETPWVCARTIIPHSTLTGREKRLAHLRNRSLGAKLFADPSMRRDELEVVRIRVGDRLYSKINETIPLGVDEIWGRRSVFYLSGKPLLVSEVFLPSVGVMQK